MGLAFNASRARPARKDFVRNWGLSEPLYVALHRLHENLEKIPAKAVKARVKQRPVYLFTDGACEE